MNLKDLYTSGEGSERINKWIDTHLSAFLKKQTGEYLDNYRPVYINMGDIQHIIDYFKAEKSKPHQRISRISVVEAHRQAKEWSDRLAKKNSSFYHEKESDVEPFITYQDGYRWVLLKTEHSFKREGNLMGHCVSSFYTHKQTLIYSLRDHENLPHCTIEVRYESKEKSVEVQKSVHQIKGRKDKAVVARYHEYIIDFLNKGEYKIHSNDLRLNFLVEQQGKVFSTSNLPENFTMDKGRLDIINPIRIPQKMTLDYLKIVNIHPAKLDEYSVFSYHSHYAAIEMRSPSHSSELTVSDFVKLNNKVVNQEWSIGSELDLSGVNIQGSVLTTKNAKFLKCVVNVDDINTTERLILNNTIIKYKKINSSLVEFRSCKEVLIDQRIDCKTLVIRNVDHVIVDTDTFIENVRFFNVKKITIIKKLNCHDLKMDHAEISTENLHKINLFNNDTCGNIEIMNMSNLEELSLSNDKIVHVNCLKINNSNIKQIKNIHGLALFSDIKTILANSLFELEY